MLTNNNENTIQHVLWPAVAQCRCYLQRVRPACACVDSQWSYTHLRTWHGELNTTQINSMSRVTQIIFLNITCT